MGDQVVPDEYSDLLARKLLGAEPTRLRVARAANSEVLALNWRIGQLILTRQDTEPWGTGVIRRLSADLRRQFPDMKGLSPSNLQYMRAFAAAWPDGSISQRSVGKLPWGHVCTLLDQVKDPALRDWYADRDADNGWTRPVLEHHVATGLHRRIGAAPSNFDQQLDPLAADQAQEIVKDPYVFDFLGLTDRATERAIEHALTARLQDTLAELGQGFAFVGRPVEVMLTVRRFFCDHVDCSACTFVELTEPYARRSPGLQAALVAVGLALAGRPGSRLATKLGMSVGRSTLLRMIHALPDPPVGQVTMPYNSGAVEGTVNRVKQLKAAMYGRAKPTCSAN